MDILYLVIKGIGFMNEKETALNKVKKYMLLCFGSEDKIFASHQCDEDEAKRLRTIALKSGIRLTEVVQIA